MADQLAADQTTTQPLTDQPTAAPEAETPVSEASPSAEEHPRKDRARPSRRRRGGVRNRRRATPAQHTGDEAAESPRAGTKRSHPADKGVKSKSGAGTQAVGEQTQEDGGPIQPPASPRVPGAEDSEIGGVDRGHSESAEPGVKDNAAG